MSDREAAQQFWVPVNTAPEQLDGRDLTIATDVWALGLVLYEVRYGRHPFAEPGLSNQALMLRRATRPLSFPAPDDATFDEHEESVIRPWLERALAKDPAERFDAHGAWRELEAVATRLENRGYRATNVMLDFKRYLHDVVDRMQAPSE